MIDIRQLGLTQRSGRGIQAPLKIVAQPPAGTHTAVLAPQPDAQVRITGRLETVTEGVLVSGFASVDVVGECARCLQPVAMSVTAKLRELYAYPGSTTAQTTDEGDISRIVDEKIDLSDLIHDELILAMPAVPLCDDNCAGLCDGCGERWADLPADHHHKQIDPRWAALAEKFSDLGDPNAN